jgi:hypothetical protein
MILSIYWSLSHKRKRKKRRKRGKNKKKQKEETNKMGMINSIRALGRGEIFTDSEGRNCFIIPNKQLKYTD